MHVPHVLGQHFMSSAHDLQYCELLAHWYPAPQSGLDCRQLSLSVHTATLLSLTIASLGIYMTRTASRLLHVCRALVTHAYGMQRALVTHAYGMQEVVGRRSNGIHAGA